MWRYLKSFLTALFPDEQYNGERPWNGHWKDLAQRLLRSQEEMFVQADTESKDVMTFEEFADWYMEALKLSHGWSCLI